MIEIDFREKKGLLFADLIYALKDHDSKLIYMLLHLIRDHSRHQLLTYLSKKEFNDFDKMVTDPKLQIKFNKVMNSIFEIEEENKGNKND